MFQTVVNSLFVRIRDLHSLFSISKTQLLCIDTRVHTCGKSRCRMKALRNATPINVNADC